MAHLLFGNHAEWLIVKTRYLSAMAVWAELRSGFSRAVIAGLLERVCASAVARLSFVCSLLLRPAFNRRGRYGARRSYRIFGKYRRATHMERSRARLAIAYLSLLPRKCFPMCYRQFISVHCHLCLTGYERGGQTKALEGMESMHSR